MRIPTFSIALLIAISLIYSCKVYAQESKGTCLLKAELKNTKYGFVNEKGKKTIAYKFEYAEDFEDGMAIVKTNGKYGFIDCNGEYIIEPMYDFASSFKEGFAMVRIDTLRGLIDKENKLFRNEWFLQVSPFYDGFTMVHMKNSDSVKIKDNDEVVAYINKNGEILNGHLFSSGSHFEKGIAKVAVNGETFNLSVSGIITPRKSDECDDALLYLIEGHEDLVMPQYPGGDYERLNFLSSHINYPSNARKQGISGTVYVTFIVNEKGKVIRPEILKGVQPALDEEAIRVISEFPNWTPASINGKNVCFRFNMPIKFTL